METRRCLSWKSGSWKLKKRRPLYLEDVEGFKLDVPAVVPQQVHHQLQVLGFTDVFCHDGEIVSVQEKFPKELETDRDRRRHLCSFVKLQQKPTGALERGFTFKDCRLVT